MRSPETASTVQAAIDNGKMDYCRKDVFGIILIVITGVVLVIVIHSLFVDNGYVIKHRC